MASFKNLEAALLTLKAEAIKHYAAIEMLISNPVAISQHTDFVDEIIKHAKALSECEEAYGSLQKHFVGQEQAPPASTPPAEPDSVEAPQPAPAHDPESVTKITEKNSPTMRRALKRAKSTKSKKNKESNKDE